MEQRLETTDWASGTFIRSPTRVALITEDDNDNVKLKLPGGRKRPGDTNPEETSRREGREETGLERNAGILRFVDRQWRRDHNYFLFLRDVTETDIDSLWPYGTHGEKVHILTIAQLLAEGQKEWADDGGLLPSHRDLLIRNRLWPT